MIYLASDHGGFSIKELIGKHLKGQEIQYKDLGPHVLASDDDYPDFILPLAERVSRESARGIIACRNGEGAAIAANKVKGIRAAVCWDEECARSARNDDNTNILSIPADYLSDLQVQQIVDTWLATPFSYDARHVRRINKIIDYENGK